MATGYGRVPPRSRGSRLLRARRSLLVERALLPTERFIHSESVTGAILFVASAMALMWANSPWRASYFELWNYTLTFDFGFFEISDHLSHWINDGLMAVFFFLVALEMKSQLVSGELSSPRQAALPAVAAVGGMLGPAAIYLLRNPSGPAAHGWGIPMATDIAFALGVMAMLGNRIPLSLRTFLLALAVVDDIGAILVIAVYYTAGISLPALATSAVLLVVLVGMKMIGVRSAIAYTVPSVIFWAAVLKSGVHATIVGVVLGLLTPTKPWFDLSSFLDSANEVMRRLRDAIRGGEEGEAAGLLGQLEALTYETESSVERRERST
jgi:NhaA family Na+:H+ antiporter